MTIPALSLDVIIHILHVFPPLRRYEDQSSVTAIVRCSQVSRTFREAACLSTLWARHYKARYWYNEPNNESARKDRFNSDPRLMFAERARIDGAALVLLDQIVVNRNKRYEYAVTLWRLGFDVWDILELAARQPKPSFFQLGSHTLPSHPDSLGRIYWAKAISQAISRAYAFKLWSRLDVDGEDAVGFPEGYAAISCFLGKHPLEMQILSEELVRGCRQYLIAQHCVYSPKVPGYNPEQAATLICEYMRNVGFAMCQRTEYMHPLTHLPHAFLTTHKNTNPISLVHVFVTIARGVGIQAYPVPFPHRVLACIAPLGPEEELTYVDVVDGAILCQRTQLTVLLNAHGLTSPADIAKHIAPCGLRHMLLRCARNMMSQIPPMLRGASFLLGFTMYLLLDDVSSANFVSSMLTDASPLDCATWLRHTLGPAITSSAKLPILERCSMILKEETNMSASPRLRSSQESTIQFFVGMVFEHRTHGYIGCIFGWDTECTATEVWMEEMSVDLLPRGRNQPFYTVLHSDGSHRYVAEDSIKTSEKISPECFAFFAREIPEISRYFKDVEIVKESVEHGFVQGRFIPGHDLTHEYPEDDLVGAAWLGQFRL